MDMSKDKAKVDLWLKEVAPSDDLRKWFSHDPKKWKEFKKRYENELKAKQELLHKNEARRKRKRNSDDSLFSNDEEHNQAVALAAFLQKA